jgi:hypothetical protein
MTGRQDEEQRRRFKVGEEEQLLSVATSRLLQQCDLRPRACIRHF